MHFLCFRLFAPLASFGDVAVGERRPSLRAPTRSMALGMVGACLGLRREDAEALAELDRSFGVATRTDAEGSLLVDYHTAQAPDGARLKAFRRRMSRPPATRREEISCTFDARGNPTALDTQLSSRQYRSDAVFVIAIWLVDTRCRWSLEAVRDALRRPIFPPYAGRRSAALGLPFEPQICEATDPVAALRTVRFSLDGMLAPILQREETRTYRWEGEWSGLEPQLTEVRRDRVSSRARWQFTIRNDYVRTERIEGERAHVAEPT